MQLRYLTLGAVLQEIEGLPSEAKLFVPFGQDWTLSTRCAVVVNDKDEEAPHSIDGALEYAVTLATVQEALDNARQQVGARLSDQQALAAFLHYYDFDAFLDFGPP